MQFLPQFAPQSWVIIAFAALALGVAKTSVPAGTVIVVPLLASQMPGQLAAGLLLPLYVAGDISAVLAYRKDAQPLVAVRLLPWALVGIGVATAAGLYAPDRFFQIMLGSVVLLSVMATVVFPPERVSRLPRWIAPIVGAVAGFATMIGNAASPIMGVYLLLMGFQKERFVGTIGYFFLITNVVKLVPHIFVWRSIDLSTALTSLFVLPVLLIGTRLGPRLLRHVKPSLFRAIVLTFSALAGLRLIVG